MNRAKPKTLYAILGASILLAALSLALFFSFYDVIFLGQRIHAPRIAFSLSEAEKVVFDPKRSEPLSAGEHTLFFSNSESEPLSVSLYAQGKCLFQGELAAKSEKEIRIVLPEKGPLSALICGESEVAYLSDAASFDAVFPEMKAGSAVFQRKTKLGKVFLSQPISFYGDFSFEELNLETEEEAEIYFSAKEKLVAPIYIFAPKAKIYMESVWLPGDDAALDFYVKAKSLNRKKLSPESIPIENFDQLKRLSDRSLLPRFFEGAKLEFSAPFSIEDSLSFSGHAELCFSAPIDFGGKFLSFSSDSEGVYRVETVLGASLNSDALLFEAPKSALLWESAGAMPSYDTINVQNNLKSYNGKSLTLGGEGKALPEILISAEENSILSEDLHFLPSGNLLVAELPFSLSEKDLDRLSFSILCQNGKASLSGTLSDGILVASDESGNQRSFAVRALRKNKSIPTVHLRTENGLAITSKSQYIRATFQMDAENTQYNSLGEVPIRIRGRGNSSWKWEKKPYKIHFDEKTSLFGLPEAEEWALISNYADKSLMRNRLGQALASELSFAYCPSHIYVDVFLNGEYLGVYTLGEHLEEGEGRVEIEHQMQQKDCGFFLEAGGVVSGVDVKGLNYFHAGLCKFVLIKSPEYEFLTNEQFEYIKDYMQKTDAAIRAGEGYEQYIDLESLIDWLIITELSYNTDCAYRRSTYFTKNPGEKLVMGPVWDFDLAFGNFSKDNAGYDTWVSSEPDDDYIGETWTTYLLESPEFRPRFRARWEEVSERLLETAYEVIDADFALLLPSAEENFQRWDILGKKVAFEPKKTEQYQTYSSQIFYLKDFLASRAEWISAQVAEW